MHVVAEHQVGSHAPRVALKISPEETSLIERPHDETDDNHIAHDQLLLRGDPLLRSGSEDVAAVDEHLQRL